VWLDGVDFREGSLVGHGLASEVCRRDFAKVGESFDVGGERFALCVRVTENVCCTLGPAAASDDVVGFAEPDGVKLESFG
jgi:hypothetical protein